MAHDKGKNVASTSSGKGKGKEKAEKAPSASRCPKARTVPASLESKAFGIKLATSGAKRRWSYLVQLKHKHCQFLHHDTVNAMGISDEIVSLMQQGGFTNIFQGNHVAYHVITMEFLSTLTVERNHQTPSLLRFQLENQQRELTMDQLNQIIGGADGNYIGDNSFDTHEMWKRIINIEEELLKYYSPTYAKAPSVRNPTFRYFHRLIANTIHSRHDSDTFLSIDFHLMLANYRGIAQDVALYLADHMENQAYIHGGQKIRIGALFTPIAQHIGVPLRDYPVSTSIYLDRKNLQQAGILSFDQVDYFFKLSG